MATIPGYGRLPHRNADGGKPPARHTRASSLMVEYHGRWQPDPSSTAMEPLSLDQANVTSLHVLNLM